MERKEGQQGARGIPRMDGDQVGFGELVKGEDGVGLGKMRQETRRARGLEGTCVDRVVGERRMNGEIFFQSGGYFC
jgi:hypothetical protein